MFKNSKRKKVLFSLLALSLITASFFLQPVLVKNALLQEMKHLGFSPAKIATSETSGSRAIFSDIQLDGNGFSTIDNIVVLGGIWGVKSATVDNLVLTGEMKGWNFPDISGWELPKSGLSLGKMTALELSGGQLDLLTPEGAIRLSSKAQMNLQPDGSQKINAIIWCKQNQLGLDTRWDVAVNPDDKTWSAAVDVREGRIDFKEFGASRISGWINIDGKKKSALPLLSGQIAAGQIRIGEHTLLANANLTIDSSNDVYHIILQGEITPYKNMHLTADITGLPTAPAVQVAIESDNLTDMINFISTLQKDMQKARGGDSFLTSLLITPGNLSRIEKEVKRTRYDSLELSVTGSPYDLVGKVVARREKNGAIQRHIISLDPG